MKQSKSSEDELVASKSPKEVRGMFTSISSSYDALNHILSLNIDKQWRRRVATTTLSKPGIHRVLDVCGGTGDMALALQKQCEKSSINPVIISSDFTPAMSAIALRKFASLSPTKNKVVIPLVADTTCLPFQDNAFDLVTVAFGIRNVVDTLGGLQEMTRVCRPGGQVAVLEFSKTRSPLINGGFQFYFTHILPAIGALVTKTRAYSYLSKSVEAFPEGKDFCRLMTQATGSPTTATPLSFGIATLYISQKV